MALTERIHARLRTNPVSLAADELAPLREAARRHELAVVCGIHERDEALGGGTLYNTVVTIGADGTLANRHRKLMPTNPERMVWGCGDATGSRPSAPRAARGRADLLGKLHAARALRAVRAGNRHLRHADLRQRRAQVATMQHIAREGGCWVVSCGARSRRAISRRRFREERALSKPRRVDQPRPLGRGRTGRQDRRRAAVRGARDPVRRHRPGARRHGAAQPRRGRPLRAADLLELRVNARPQSVVQLH